MGNNKLEKNPTIQDIKNFLGKIEENINNFNISIDGEILTISLTTTNIIGD